MIALFDPYAYQTRSRQDLKTMNAVGESLLSAYEEADPEHVCQAILSAYRPGIAAFALRMHVLRILRLESRFSH